MTKLLERAFAEASKLPEAAQDEVASIVLQELEAEQHWDRLFARPESAELLARLADEALAEHRAGHTHKLDVNEL